MALKEQMIRLNGSSSTLADLGRADSFELTGDFTIEMWISCLYANKPILGVGIDKTATELLPGKSFGIGVGDGGQLVAQIIGGPAVLGITSILSTGKSHSLLHVAVRYTRGTQELALFVNGEIEAVREGCGSFNPDAASRVAVGRSNLISWTHNGYCSDVRFFRVARTKRQIKQDMFRRLSGLEEDLTRYFPLDGIPPDGLSHDKARAYDAKIVLDPITRERTNVSRPAGTMTNVGLVDSFFPWSHRSDAVVTTPAVVVGELDGVTSHISVPHSDSLTPGTMTVEAFVRPTGAGRPYYAFPVISKHGPGQGWELRAGAGRGGFLIAVDDAYHDLNVPIENDVWHHLAGVYDGSSMTFYVNGMLRASKAVPSATSPGKITPYPGEMNIGRNPHWTAHRFAGQIAEIRLFYSVRDQRTILLNIVRSARFPSVAGGIALYRMEGNALDSQSPRSHSGTATNVRWVASDPPVLSSSATATAAVTPDTYLDAVAQSNALEEQRMSLERQIDDEKRLHAGATSQAEKLGMDLGALDKEKSRLTDRIAHLDSLETDIEKLDGEIESLTNEINALKSPRGQISLADFVQKAHAEIQSARDALAATGAGYAFARMNLEVKMLPAPDGANLTFPELADVQALGADKLSALTIRFDSAETTTIAAAQVEVPSVVGTTETLARRTLAARRFVTETSYHAIPPSGTAITEADRVVTQLPAAGTSAPAGSKVTIFLGRET